MSHPMRRKDRALSNDEARELLEHSEYVFLATVGKDGAPYVVPLSYVVVEDVLYFHCAETGRKIDNIAFCPKVCMAVVGATEPIFDGGFSTYFESAVAEGEARPVGDAKEKRMALLRLADKYLPEHMDKAEDYITKLWDRTWVYAVDIKKVSGKSKRPKAAA